MFVGYPYGKKGWRLFDLDDGEYFDSRDVVFDENVFPFLDKTSVSSPVSVSLPPDVRDTNIHELGAASDRRPAPGGIPVRFLVATFRLSPRSIRTLSRALLSLRSWVVRNAQGSQMFVTRIMLLIRQCIVLPRSLVHLRLRVRRILLHNLLILIVFRMPIFVIFQL